MTVAAIDTYRCAWILVKQHGQAGAVIEATMRIDELNAESDAAGVQAWMTILAAVEEIGRVERRAGEVVQ